MLRLWILGFVKNSLKPCIEFRLKVTCELDEIPLVDTHEHLQSEEDVKLLAHLLPGDTYNAING